LTQIDIIEVMVNQAATGFVDGMYAPPEVVLLYRTVSRLS
jgi:hypothetical protein